MQYNNSRSERFVWKGGGGGYKKTHLKDLPYEQIKREGVEKAHDS